MRCAQCDRLAVPQAVGRSPDGLVVFGWCLDCLEEAGCTEIEAVTPRSTRARLTPPSFPSGLESITPHLVSARSDRRRLSLVVSSLLGVWAIVLVAVGVWTIDKPPPADPSPFGNGRPMLFLVGGVATALTALILLSLSHGRAMLTSRQACRWIQSGSFLLALAILLVGIVFHDPKRDPFVVAAAGLALGLSIGVHWQERRLPAATVRPRPLTADWLRRH